ncbi:MAG: SPOR domain-containing protein [Paracoccaceae bacterium]
MCLKVMVLAVCATLLGFGVAGAQSLADVGGPRELPPAGYKSQQYVDSRGCVFLRAGYGGQTNWVPRVTAQRRALCGYPPTFGKVVIEMADETPAPAPVVVAAAPTPAPAPAPRVAVSPAATAPATYTAPAAARPRVATAPTPTVRVTAPAPYTDTAPARTAAPVRTYETAAAGPGPGQIGCFTSAPVAEVVRLRNGGTAVVCTRGDGTLNGWRSPIYPAGARVGAALSDTVARGGQNPGQVTERTATVRYADADAIPTPPKGYKLAWKDDRLNPNRGKGTAAGQAAQDQIWTRDVPAKLVADQPRKKGKVVVSSKAAPKQQAVRSGGALVQVGTFGVPANADGAAARLAALGLPVAKGNINKGGKSLQIVFAGPFASAGEAQAALSAARRAGFSDAFVR